MKPALRLSALALLLFCCAGFSRGPDFIVRFLVESNERDTERFSAPVQLKYPPRATYLARVPVVSERNIKGIFPFSAPDHTWGCTFQLDPIGRLQVLTISTENRGRSMVVYVGTKKGTHQVIDMIIDRPIDDGIVTIQRGLTIGEIDALQKRYPILGKRGKAKEPEGPKKPSGLPRDSVNIDESRRPSGAPLPPPAGLPIN